MSEGTGEDVDPFAPENVGTVQLIVQMRIYDVLMALLAEQNQDRASDLLEIHTSGGIMGPAPRLSGDFITDQVNADG